MTTNSLLAKRSFKVGTLVRLSPDVYKTASTIYGIGVVLRNNLERYDSVMGSNFSVYFPIKNMTLEGLYASELEEI